MPQEVLDRRVRRTRARLAQAAQSVLEEGCWAGASVQSLSDRADLARSSFYAHFAGKPALLDLLIDQRLANAEQDIAALSARSGRLATVTWLAWHMKSARALYREVLGPSGQRQLRRKISDRVAELLGAELCGRGAAPRQDAMRFAADGILAVLEDWLHDPSGPLASELEERLNVLVAPVLENRAVA
ncbi:TetR/AcrR family transcriptional regulator [Roseisalinus antarcticus]|uniref:HTH tetR-type domain-containing protein n=1 Tax=Roseisalinus antarcticus TaxID=254357 RepID=A0A1Y5SJD9_9RHOB|nr:TetR family transcriptional regulator [Roseisalinus antarcticus]SLN40980.1 hypothetical protein ROA7023_01613 [Roseisalinus antarcticus]